MSGSTVGDLYWALFWTKKTALALWCNWPSLSPWRSDPKTILGQPGKRDLTPSESFDPHVYIDSIGVPRGVPNGYEAQN